MTDFTKDLTEDMNFSNLLKSLKNLKSITEQPSLTNAFDRIVNYFVPILEGFFLSGFLGLSGYRKWIQIDPVSGTGTNYPIKFTVYKQTVTPLYINIMAFTPVVDVTDIFYLEPDCMKNIRFGPGGFIVKSGGTWQKILWYTRRLIVVKEKS